MQIVTGTSAAIPLRVAIEAYMNNESGSVNTQRAKRLDLEAFVEFEGRKRSVPMVHDLTRKGIEEFRDHCLRHRHEAPTTVARRLATIRHFCRTLAETFKDFADPSRYVRLPRVVQQAPKYLTVSEKIALRVAAQKSEPFDEFKCLRNQIIVELGISCGLRRAEIRDVLMAHFKPGYKQLCVLGKGNVFAVVPTSERLQQLIERYLPHREEYIRRHMRLWDKVSPMKQELYPLLCSAHSARSGDPESFKLDVKSVWRIVVELGKKAGIAGCHTHRLRHTFIDSCYRASNDIALASRAARHSNINTTMAYVRKTDDEVAKMVSQLG